MKLTKLGCGNEPYLPDDVYRIRRFSHCRLLCVSTLRPFAPVVIVFCVLFLTVACGTNAATNTLSPTATSQHGLSPTVTSQPTATPSPASVFPPRQGSSMTYDTATGMVLLFGGAAGPPYGHLNDTWEWNGTTWLPLHPTTSPSPRVDASMVYDAATKQVVLFGGVSNSGDLLGDTWIWNGMNWIQQHPPSSPSARDAAAMVYDPAAQAVVLFGGETGQGRISPALNDTWLWTGTRWQQAQPVTLPPPRTGASMAYDARTQQIVLFGGGNNFALADTWLWNGATWSQAHPSASPPARVHASMAYDAATEQVVLFGGENGSVELNDTWVWDGTTWIQQQVSQGPGGGYSSAAYDAVHHSILAFSSAGTKQNETNETWMWTGTTWKQLD